MFEHADHRQAEVREHRVSNGLRVCRRGLVIASVFLGLGVAPDALAADAPPDPVALAESIVSQAENSGEPVSATSTASALGQGEPWPAAEGVVDATVAALESSVIPPTSTPDIASQEGHTGPDAHGAPEDSASRASEQVDALETASSEPVTGGGDELADDAPATDHLAGVADGADGAASGTSEGHPSSGVAEEGSAAASNPSSGGADDAENSSRYHEDNLQYQDSANSESDTWIWIWNLDIQCDGRALSTSQELGLSSSSDWVWQWVWNWCGDGVPELPSGALVETSSDGDIVESLSVDPIDGPSGGSELSAEDDAAGDAPWSWAWTFEFCDRTYSLALQLEGTSPVTWGWDWSWLWSCPTTPRSTAGSGPAAHENTNPSVDSGGGNEPIGAPVVGPAVPDLSDERAEPAVLQAAVDLPTVELLPLSASTGLSELVEALAGIMAAVSEGGIIAPMFETLGTAPEIRALPPFAWPEPTEPTEQPALLNPPWEAITPLPGSEQRPAGRSRAQQSSASASPARAPSPSTWVPAAAEPKRDVDRAEATKSRSVRPRQAAPSELPPWSARHAPAQPSGGVVPGSATLGVAALVALFILAVPPLGWRVLAARELRPRSAYRPPIDHPG